MIARGPEISTKVSQKKSEPTKSPFASMLKSEIQQKPTEQKKQEQSVKTESQQVFGTFSGDTEQEKSVNQLIEAVQAIIESTELPTELTEEMLTNGDISWLHMLPTDLVEKIQSLFESGTSLQQLLGSEDSQFPVENLLAGLIYIQQASNQEQLQAPSKDVLATFFQQLNGQLQKLTQDEQMSTQLFTKQSGLTNELQQFLSSIHAKLTGKNSIATDENQKLDYLRLLYQRTVKTDEAGKNNSLQDSNSKVNFVGVETQTNLNRTQQFSLFVEQSSSKTVNQEQFIKEFQSILAKSNLLNANGGMKLLIKLYPEHLGQLRVELLQQNGVLTARMVASTAAAKDMLESQLQGLKNAFAGQNIQVEKVEIINSQALQDEFNRSLDRDGNQQEKQSPKGNQDKVEEQQNENTFGATLLEELMNTEV